jgi:hypothetical protein
MIMQINAAELGPYLLGPNDENQGIYTGDARELAKAIPDESVDLIFTDPVYDRIEDYRWLAETAARVLKPDSACLVWGNMGLVKDYLLTMNNGLSFHWPLTFKLFRMIAGRPKYRRVDFGFSHTTPCLWFDKGHVKTNHCIHADLDGNFVPKNAGEHGWTKAMIPVLHWMPAFASDGAFVLDPFTGGGTVPAVCKMLGRRWLAFEIDSDVAERARERVRMTQPPLFVAEPEQLDLGMIT